MDEIQHHFETMVETTTFVASCVSRDSTKSEQCEMDGFLSTLQTVALSLSAAGVGLLAGFGILGLALLSAALPGE